MTIGETRVVQWWVRLLGAILLLLFVFLAYAHVGAAGFIWDDESHLTQNPSIVGPLGLADIWTSASAVYYPLVLTTFWILHHSVGLTPLPYHVLNVAFHAASALLLWRVLVQLEVRGAWLGAAMWALDPVMVQSVAWITEMKNTQSALFYLLAISCFLQSRDRKRVFYWLTIFFFVAAITSKPSTVILPVVLALCLWWREGGIAQRDLRLFLPFVLISLLASGWTIWEQKFHSHATGAEWVQTPLQRILISADAIWFYLLKLIWPYPLIFIYPRWHVNSSGWLAWIPLVALLVAATVLFVKRNAALRPVAFAFAYFVITLFPVLDFFDVYFFRYSFVSDHFQYLASMGPLALAGAGIVTGCNRLPAPRRLSALSSTSRHGAVVTTPLVGICGVLLLSLGFLRLRQTALYHYLVTLYTRTLARNPGCWMAHYNLGIALNDQGNPDGAIAHYRKAIDLRSSYAEAHYNLGRLLVQKGLLDEAIAHYEKALEMNTADAEAHNNLGATLFANGHVDEAIAHYRKALAIKPDYADVSCNLASALLSKGDLDGVISYYSACLAVSPDQAEAQYNLASALFRTGRMDEAIAHYQKVLELRPENVDARANLGSLFLAKGRIRDAIAQYRRALRIAPDNVAAQSNLAWLLATAADPSLRNGSEAVFLAERAESDSSRSQNHAIILRILAAAYAETGRFPEAKGTAEQALQAAEVQGISALSNALRDELTLYELGLPYHK